MSDTNNLELWNAVEETDPNYVKKVEYGERVFDAVDAYFRLKVATEMWGPYGSTWGLYDIEYKFHESYALLKCRFNYPGGEFPISNSIKVRPDFIKMIETDTITKALSRLGFSADVYMGRFEDDTYVSEVKKKRRLEEKKAILIYTMDKYRQEIDIIKTALAEDDLSAAAEVYIEMGMNDLNNLDVKPLNIAPTVCKKTFGFDGPFTTQERDTMKSDVFSQHMRDFAEADNER